MSYIQWNSQTPGLSATNRKVAEWLEGICTVSRRIGFACPSAMGGLSAGSEDVKSSERPTIMNLCP